MSIHAADTLPADYTHVTVTFISLRCHLSDRPRAILSDRPGANTTQAAISMSGLPSLALRHEVEAQALREIHAQINGNNWSYLNITDWN